jgi:hypothetical protein
MKAFLPALSGADAGRRKNLISFVFVQKWANLFAIKAPGKFYRRHMADIPRIKFFAQRRYREHWTFLDGH